MAGRFVARRPATMAMLLGMLLALAPAGHGAVVYYSGPTISIPDTYAGVSVDLETGNSSTDLGGLGGGDANFYYGGARVGNDADQDATVPSWQPVRTEADNNTAEIVNLTVGTAVGPASMYYDDGFGASGSTSSHFGGAGGFTDDEVGYIGFSLVIDGPLIVYGWAKVRLQDDDGVGELLEWAYDDTGASINVGQIPEPATTILLGGLAVLALMRRKRD